MFEHLKNFKSIEGYWSSNDCIDIAKDILHETGAKSMLEIGFNIGYSANIWLENGIDRLVIIDINNHKDTEPAIIATVKHHADKDITWWLGDSISEEAFSIDTDKVDISFIDGKHSYGAALNDACLSIVFGAKWLVFDDVIKNHENGIYEAIHKLISIGLISLTRTYPMTWTEQGSVFLCKVNL